jgi:uncharacterized damage-inducible protein DinB
MLVEIPFTRSLLFTALEQSPLFFEYLLKDLTEEEADQRPDPERFTIREVVAHVAEWETIFLERMQLTCAHQHPVAPAYDPNELAARHNYAGTDVAEQFANYCASRAQTVKFLRARTDVQWPRLAHREGFGDFSLEAQALHVTLHDGYHHRQIAHWRSITK